MQFIARKKVANAEELSMTAESLVAVLTGSTQLEVVGDYVYQPTRILDSVADLTDEIKTGKVSDRLNSPVYSHSGFHSGKPGNRHQTDTLAHYKPLPRPAMTK